MSGFEVVQLLQQAMNLFDGVQSKRVNLNGSDHLRIEKFQKLKSALLLIQRTALFDDILIRLTQQGLLSFVGDEVTISPSTAPLVEQDIIKLFDTVQRLLTVLVSATGEIKPENVFIKLAEVRDFAQMAGQLEVFNKILSQAIINDTIKGEIVIEGVQSGSIWIQVYLGSAGAVSLVGGLAWSAAVIYKKYQEGKYIRELVNQQGVQAEEKTVLMQAQKRLTDLMIDAEATHLYHEYFKNKDSDPEQIQRLKHSIKLLSEEIARGAEIVPALAAPEDVKNLFPDMRALPTIESKVKKIENNK